MRHVEHRTSIYIEFKTLRYDGQLLYTEQASFIFCQVTGRVMLKVLNYFWKFFPVAKQWIHIYVNFKFHPCENCEQGFLHDFPLQEGSESGRDFLAVSIVNGFVEFRYNLGSGLAVLRSLKKVIPGMWHSVSVKRYHQDSVLVMDTDPEVLGSVAGDLKSLDLTSSTYIGNVPNLLDQAAFNMGTSQGLIGCIRRLKWGHRNIRFHFDHEPAFKSAFQISECNDKLCQDITCYNQVI